MNGYEIPDRLMREMRSSVVFLGAILGRAKRARLCAPGGCEIGLRPIDLHISAMEQLGARLKEEGGRLEFTVPKELSGARITLSFPSVGATGKHPARRRDGNGQNDFAKRRARAGDQRPCGFFERLRGAYPRRGGQHHYHRRRKAFKRHGAHGHPRPHRRSTYLLAGAVTQGRICVKDIIPAHLGALLPVMKEAGCDITASGRWICMSAPPRLHRVK